MSLSALRPAIITILRHSDIDAITAKGVRARLSTEHQSSIPQGIDLNGKDKKGINDLIRECFDEEIGNRTAAANSTGHQQAAPPTGGLALPGTGGVPGGLPGHTVKPASSNSSKKRAKSEIVDEIESDDEPGASKKKPAAKKRKSAAKEEGGAEKPKRAANPNNPFNAPLILDEILADVCGEAELPRPQIVKKIWEHIKGNKLQDPSNGRKVLCDPKLKRLFGKDEVDSFEIAKHISAHVTKKPAAPPAATA